MSLGNNAETAKEAPGSIVTKIAPKDCAVMICRLER